MKSSEEMYRSLLHRRDEYEKSRRVNRKAAITVAVASCVPFLLLAGAFIWHKGQKKTDESVQAHNAVHGTGYSSDSNEDMSSVTQEIVTVHTDEIGLIITGEKEYRQYFPGNADYTRKECIGRASDFDGSYKNSDTDGDIYTVNEADNVLMLLLDNGGIVYLKAAA